MRVALGPASKIGSKASRRTYFSFRRDRASGPRASLLIRLAENATGETWCNLRFELEKCHLVRFAGSAGDVLQRTELTARQVAIFTSLAVPEPPRYAGLPTPAVTASA
jgi:hypothetical protein